MAKPEYQTVRVKPTSRHRGKTQNTKPSGSNRPHGTVEKTQNTQPSGSNRPHDTVVKTQNIKPSGSNQPHGTVAKTRNTQPSGSNRPHCTLVKTQNIKPSESNRPHGTVANPIHYNIIIEPNLQYNLVHHLITSNSMFLLTCAFFQRHRILG